MLIGVIVLPLDVSLGERLLAAAGIAVSVLVGIVAATTVHAEWAMLANSIAKIVGAVAGVAAIPELFLAGLVYITASVVATAAVQERADSTYLAISAALGLAIVAGVRDAREWFLPLGVMVVVALATRAWAREWRAQRDETDRRFDDLIDSTRMFFWEADPKTGRVLSITGNTLGTLGYQPEEMLDMSWEHIIAPSDQNRVSQRFADGLGPDERLDTTLSYRHRDGHIVALRQLVRVGRNGTLTGAATDITSLHESSETLRHQAEHDMLTGLPNRLKFQTELDRLLGRDRQDVSVGLLLLDLDGFKEINDTLGHNIGDQVLQRLADRFRNSLEGAELSARIGGDEFAVLVVDHHGKVDVDRMVQFASELMQLVDQPIQIGDLRLAIRASAGIAIAPDHGDNPDALLQHADIALYQAKSSVDRYSVYAPTPGKRSVERLQLSARIPDALANGEFELWFQPKVDLSSGKLIGVEGLARWRHPDLGVLTPDRFLALLGVAGEYQSFTNQMIAIAIDFLGACQRAGKTLSVAVNLGSVSFLDTELPGRIASMLEVHGVDPDSLILEVTEEEILLDRDSPADVFAQLERIGLRLSIDDFGTGYSSLARLRSLKIDELKIDRSFVTGLNVDPEDRAIVGTIIELAKQLNQETVAEGIETIEQLALLQSLGCDSGQGYLFDKPMRAHEFLARLDDDDFDYSERFGFEGNAGWFQQQDDPQRDVGLDNGIVVNSPAIDVRACLITDRQRAEFMSALVDMLPVGIWVKDADLRFVRGNAMLRSALGLGESSALLNRKDADLHPERKEVERFDREDRQVLETGRMLVSQVERQTRADGRTEAIVTSKYPIRNADDDVIGLVGFYTKKNLSSHELVDANSPAAAEADAIATESAPPDQELKAPRKSPNAV